MKINNIRNFAIIAHIDHGKSTLADRIMEYTDTVSNRQSTNQLLDDMEVEQEHGVTVKSRTVRNFYHADNGEEYEYNSIDTPGHVDFNYEVSKSLGACEGAIFLVDATQGVEAQTIANYRLAKESGIVIIPVINKIDIPTVNIEDSIEQLHNLDSNFNRNNVLTISAKTGQGMHQLLEKIAQEIPSPKTQPHRPLKALVFDSLYNSYKGIILYVKVIEGKISSSKQ